MIQMVVSFLSLGYLEVFIFLLLIYLKNKIIDIKQIKYLIDFKFKRYLRFVINVLYYILLIRCILQFSILLFYILDLQRYRYIYRFLSGEYVELVILNWLVLMLFFLILLNKNIYNRNFY